MPADPGTRSIFGDESVPQFRGSESREIGSLLKQSQQKARNVLGVAPRALTGLVMCPERDDTPLAKIAMKFIFLEMQLSKMFQKYVLFLQRHEVRSVFEALWQGDEWFKKAELPADHARPILPIPQHRS